MTSLPPPSEKKLGLVTDLDICVGCHACAVSCKEWNTGGHAAPLPDFDPFGSRAAGVWFNRVHIMGKVGRNLRRTCPAVGRPSAFDAHRPLLLLIVAVWRADDGAVGVAAEGVILTIISTDSLHCLPGAMASRGVPRLTGGTICSHAMGQ